MKISNAIAFAFWWLLLINLKLVESCTLKDKCGDGNFENCDFDGCENEIELSLDDRGLSGKLPADIRNMTKLKKLYAGPSCVSCMCGHICGSNT